MASTDIIRQRLLNYDLKTTESQALEENTSKVKELETDQLKRGLKQDGTKIGKYRNEHYAVQKYIQNPLAGFGNVDLIKTGQLSSEIFVDVREDIFVIDSADPKTGDLIKKYGDPFGLTQESKKILIDNGLRKSFVKISKEKLHL